MISKILFRARTTKTSVQLMTLAQALNALPGVIMASSLHCTPANQKLLEDSGIAAELPAGAGPSDLVVAVSAESEAAALAALNRAEELLGGGAATDPGPSGVADLDAALTALPGADLALISVPGAAAAPLAREALERGLHVHLFSDNVSLADERALKETATAKGLLLMGPGCGTAIINGAPLGFANVVRAGAVGVISAAGTGLQEFTSLLSRQGLGVSQAIGVGGRDLSKDIGGLMMLAALEALDRDPATEILALISKPPDPEVMAEIVRRAESCAKPVVLCLLGGEAPVGSKLHFAATIDEAVTVTRRLLTGKEPGKLQAAQYEKLVAEAAAQYAKRAATQKYIRGFYVGGTMCYEALCLLSASPDLELRGNVAFKGAPRLADSAHSEKNTLIDFGEEEFTLGRLHPMMDPSLRHLRLLQEAKDPEVGLLLLDFVLGYGSHADPVGAFLPVLKQMREISQGAGRHLTIIASVIGTDQDPQNRRYSVTRLRDLGVIVTESNAQAAGLALAVSGGKRE